MNQQKHRKMKTTHLVKGILNLLFAILLFNSTSCTHDMAEEFPQVEEMEMEQNLKVSIEWTAFKFPSFEDRVGVSGSFDSFEYSITPGTDTNTVLDQLMDSEIMIPTNSVNVGNDSMKTSNIGHHFFPYFTSHIDCKIIKIDPKSAEIAISMNGVTEHAIFEVELDEENKIVKISGTIEDLMVFQAETAFSKLNEMCGFLHNGFVWPDVAINVTIENYDFLK